MDIYTVKFTAERRSDGSPYERIVEVRALTLIEAEDAALRKCRLLGYRNYAVEVIAKAA